MGPLCPDPKEAIPVQEITSLQNPTVKELVRLTAQRRARQERGLFLAESPKLAAEAALAGVPVRTLYATPDALERYQDTLAPALAAAGEVVAISRPVAEKLAASRTTQGVFALCAIPSPRLTPDTLRPDGRYLVLASLQDPGNVGAAIRSALAFGCDGLLLTGDCPDLYGPKVLRAAMGGVFRLPLFAGGTLPELLAALQAAGIETWAAALDRQAVTLDAAALDRDGVAVVIGNEGNGLPPEMVAACGRTVFIPISAQSESLNASVAASLFLWEMRRR